jgi:ubiquinone biosynthesis protein Coq4
MRSTEKEKQQWEDLVLTKFRNLVESADGYFAAIGQLATLLNDERNFDMTID